MLPCISSPARSRPLLRTRNLRRPIVFDLECWCTTFPLRAILTGHTAAFSPDGKRVVTASQDKTARVWDAASGQPVATLRGHTDMVNSAAFSPDGQRVVTASEDKTAQVWDAASGQLLASLQGHTSGVSSAAFSPDGKRIVTASRDKTARVWDAAAGQPVSLTSGAH